MVRGSERIQGSSRRVTRGGVSLEEEEETMEEKAEEDRTSVGIDGTGSG